MSQAGNIPLSDGSLGTGGDEAIGPVDDEAPDNGRKQISRRSEIWKYYTAMGTKKAAYNYCFQVLSCDSQKNSTSSLVVVFLMILEAD